MAIEAELARRSIRLLIDLQACQTEGSANRGVGRYSQALFSAMVGASGGRRIHSLTSSQLQTHPDLRGVPGNRRHEVGELPQWNSPRDHAGGDQDTLDAIALSSVIADIEPDVVHISHVFEGFADRIALPSYSNRPFGQVLSATLYDLIPYRFPEVYFADENFSRWYAQRVRWLRNADLLLAISESSRTDAIELLDLDPSRIVTIYGGVAEQFRALDDPAGARKSLFDRYRIRRPSIVLYTGGDDHRKNIAGAIHAFALLPAALRATTQLVVVCSISPDRKAMYLDLARRSGLGAEEIIFTGFVPEADLIAFYSVCDVFVFPSLYEGFGLPVLEAMACGAPVIGGDNSSIRELIENSDAMFNASDVPSIASKIAEVLTNPALAERLRLHGLSRAPNFTWERSARLALAAMDEALSRKRREGVTAARAGWLKRQRLAVLTPLPPSRSGIADYNAAFLPYLEAHFDIDLFVDARVSNRNLNASFRIFDVRDFDRMASAYDAILYEVGNSEFHVHMLPLLERHPGVVGLHDAFLSGMMGYLQFNLGEKDRYFREMLDAHASAARRYFAPMREHPDPVGASMVDLPCSRSVIQAATGIISFSNFNKGIAEQFYPEGWRSAWRVIPQMAVVPALPEESRDVERAKLGIRPDEFVVATFGQVTWTKCGDRLLEAFALWSATCGQRCRLVFAGQLSKDQFGLALYDRIRHLGLDERVAITGFLHDNEYTRLLRISDVAVQLRQASRGETSKSLLDCLSHSLPVIVNDYASSREYPDGAVLKISADPAPLEISQALAALHNSPVLRRQIARCGLKHVQEHHNARACAAQYAAAITEFTSRARARKEASFIESIAPHLGSSRQHHDVVRIASEFALQRERFSIARPRIIVDVSHIASFDHRTGIQRVVREITRALYCSSKPGFEVLAAELGADRILREAKQWLEGLGLLLPFEQQATPNEVEFRRGDILLMLDSSWTRYSEFAHVFESARSRHVPIVTAVYDILPITLPLGNFVPGGREWFSRWIQQAIRESDAVVCISKATADSLLEFMEREKLLRSGLKVGWWHLGSEIAANAEYVDAGAARNVPRPFTCMVGTLEPRKNHSLALDAFEQLWACGIDLSLVIAGKPGWLADELVDRLRTHSMRGKRLYFFENPSDCEIAYFYREAAALMMLSKDEGFGLPIVEASHFGTPILASEIPVFREIAGDGATYVDTRDAASLARDLKKWFAATSEGHIRSSEGIRRLSWEESSTQLLGVLLGEQWYVML